MSRSRSRSRSRSSERDDYKQREDENRSDHGENKTGLHIKNLHPRTSEEEIKEAFSRYGEVISTSVIRDPHTRM